MPAPLQHIPEGRASAPLALKVGVVLVGMCCLAYELLLTRIFSVTIWHHFACMAVSTSMFGLTIGALAVRRFPKFFSIDLLATRLSQLSLFLGLSIPTAIGIHLALPLNPTTLESQPIALAINFVAVSIPFVLVGMVLCTIFENCHGSFAKLYGYDLLGAGFGGVALFFLFKVVGGLTLPFVIGLFAVTAAVSFTTLLPQGKSSRFAIVTFVALLLLVFVQEESKLLSVATARGKALKKNKILYDRWNSYSRIVVRGSMQKKTAPFGWGFSRRMPQPEMLRQLYLDIDSTAGTTLHSFDGNLAPFSFLKYDIVNLAHYLRPHAQVAVIGVGGGRDVLSALVFNQQHVQGIEVNDAIVQLVSSPLASFLGNLFSRPEVSLVNDEARSYLASHTERFDIIQGSLVDTYAATSAGAFALTESGLYTVEAWSTFLERLTPRGVLSFSRWYDSNNQSESLRLVSLAWSALTRNGVEDPRAHILLFRSNQQDDSQSPQVATIMVSKKPYSVQDLDVITKVTDDLEFVALLTPNGADAKFEAAARRLQNPATFSKKDSVLTAPTDDRPFFFHLLDNSQIFERQFWSKRGSPFPVLITLLVVTFVLSMLFIIFPLVVSRDSSFPRLEVSGFFALIGAGFMLIEISLLQKFSLFLGHPSLGLAISLPAILIGAGIGSLVTQNLLGVLSGSRRSLFLVSTVGIATSLIATLFVLHSCQATSILIRTIAAVCTLMPLGAFLGMMFPAGAATLPSRQIPWVWGVNGVFSVCFSIVAVFMGVSWGLSSALFVGFGCYLGACALTRRRLPNT